jgi:hypothetical protein
MGEVIHAGEGGEYVILFEDCHASSACLGMGSKWRTMCNVVEYEALAEVVINVAVFWDIAPCGLYVFVALRQIRGTSNFCINSEPHDLEG